MSVLSGYIIAESLVERVDGSVWTVVPSVPFEELEVEVEVGVELGKAAKRDSGSESELGRSVGNDERVVVRSLG